MSNFIARTCIKVNRFSGGQYSSNKNIRFKNLMLRSDLCDYSDAHIVVEGTITVESNNINNREDKKLTFKNHSPFRSWISKINNTFVDSVEDIDIVMLIFNMLEYSNNYSMTSESLWNYYRDDVNNDVHDVNTDNYNKNNNKPTRSIPFEYKTKITKSTPGNNNTELSAEVFVIWKYLSNFWRSLELPLINCEIGHGLSWSQDWIIFKKFSRNPGDPGNPNANSPNFCIPQKSTSDVTFHIITTKIYVPLINLPINDNIKFLEHIKQRFKRTTYSNKYRSEI